MALTAIASQLCHPTFSCFLNPSKILKYIPKNLTHSNIITRRVATIAAVNTILLARETMFNMDVASAFDFRMTVPDQTPEEAEGTIKDHARELLEVKDLIESEQWRDAQKALRKSSSYLKQDIYTLIQAKPGSERPPLRLLYSNLFNNVTRLDYAARSKDVVGCKESFQNIVVFLDDILSKL
ncbi:hypothetical protein IFM89_007764 [Coptis chinensis]|uniref:PsbQ-like protein 3, chloroplastic n=1 Tax=Coptis chinensis TaxID=261450 RepID=A0A835IUY3_9MAGN|nr:hypothetical protein IFM89_007764 [Coptis chinensis]